MKVTAVVGGVKTEFESQDPSEAYGRFHGMLAGNNDSSMLIHITEESRESAIGFSALATAICLFAFARGRRLNWCANSPDQVAVFSG